MLAPLVFSERYNTDLASFGIDKPFALDRAELVLRKLREELPGLVCHAPVPLTEDDILSVHTLEYLHSLGQDQTWQEIFELKPEDYRPDTARFPLHEILEDIKLKSGGTNIAIDLALTNGLAANLGGGYHHAFADRGRGFCSINDVAIGIRTALRSGRAKQVLIVDLDFHQGDGTASIFKDEPRVFTLSVHSAEGWPENKQISSLDVPILESENRLYLEKTEGAIDEALRRFAPDLVLYVAGSDPYEKDVLPGTKFIRLSLDEIRKRDRYVIDIFAKMGIPLAMVFAGGYGPDVWEVHYWATRRLLERSGHIVESATNCD
jgi:acetoin utilization deacetylase AcuC-like enzyme